MELNKNLANKSKTEQRMPMLYKIEPSYDVAKKQQNEQRTSK
jgi:hypothetical protein